MIYDDGYDKNKPNLSTIFSLRIKSSFPSVLHTLSAKQNVVNLSPNLMNFLSVIQCLLNFFVSHSPFLTLTLAVCFCSGTTGMACSRFLAHKLHQFYNFFHCLSCFLLHGDIIVAIFKERIASLKFPCKKISI